MTPRELDQFVQAIAGVADNALSIYTAARPVRWNSYEIADLLSTNGIAVFNGNSLANTIQPPPTPQMIANAAAIEDYRAYLDELRSRYLELAKTADGRSGQSLLTQFVTELMLNG